MLENCKQWNVHVLRISERETSQKPWEPGKIKKKKKKEKRKEIVNCWKKKSVDQKLYIYIYTAKDKMTFSDKIKLRDFVARNLYCKNAKVSSSACDHIW